jgi:Domain of unknown function (DUF4249)
VKRLVIKYLLIKTVWLTLFFAFIILSVGCIKQFIPETSLDQDLLVVEGLITDKPGNIAIKLSTSMPLGIRSSAKPLSGCDVNISDDLGNLCSLHESVPGTYIPDSLFQGIVGRSYTLHVKTNSAHHNLSYQSLPVLMKPVPPIDSVYYERVVLTRGDDGSPTGEGCQIYLNTHDPQNSCRFYRWEFVETWKFSLPYIVSNKVCWVTSNSDNISIKNTTSLSDDKVVRFPLNLITNATDRLLLKYSILVNQYSLNENEYEYWEKMQNVLEQVGSLYDMTPASIPSNITCVEKPSENVMGYFSVSAVKSKRIFITEKFRGMPDLYYNCQNKSVGYNDYIPGLNTTIWVIIDHPQPPPGYKILSYFRGCADCTDRGTNIKPDFWDDSK